MAKKRAPWNRNILLKILNVQQITIEYQSKGVTKKWIYENIIYPRFYISQVTFYNYLNINARKELREIGYDWQKINKNSIELKNKENERSEKK